MQFVSGGSIRKFQFHNNEECIACVAEMDRDYVTLITSDGCIKVARVDAIKEVLLMNFEVGLRRKLTRTYSVYKECRESQKELARLKQRAENAELKVAEMVKCISDKEKELEVYLKEMGVS